MNFLINSIETVLLTTQNRWFNWRVKLLTILRSFLTQRMRFEPASVRNQISSGASSGRRNDCIRSWTRSDLNSALHSTESSHRVIMGKSCDHSPPSFLIGSSSSLQVTRTCIKSRMWSNFEKIRLETAEFNTIERLENSPYTYNGRNVTNLVPSSLDGSSSFLHVTRTTIIKAWISLNFNQIPFLSIERLKSQCIML